MPSDLIERIQELRASRRAVILAHNYQRPEIQDIADMTGDSLELARAAARIEAEVIVLCGVYFMAETAAILCPGKRVLIPDANAGCPLANMITPRELEACKAAHPGAWVVTYVNSSAQIKAMSDICCTSANALEVVRRAPKDREVIFAPDRNLGDYVSKQLGRELVLWNGYCPTHERILPEFVEAARREHPGALVVAHPECRPPVVAMADVVGSTSGILKTCRESDRTEFIIGTELGLLHRLHKENPGKRFYAAGPFSDCPNMKLTTIEKILWRLEEMGPEVRVAPDVAQEARGAIQRMVDTLAV